MILYLYNTEEDPIGNQKNGSARRLLDRIVILRKCSPAPWDGSLK